MFPHPSSTSDRDAMLRNLKAVLTESLVEISNIEDTARSMNSNPCSYVGMGRLVSPTYIPDVISTRSYDTLHWKQIQSNPTLMGISANNLLLAMAKKREQTRSLEQARATIVLAQERERILKQQSYQSLLRFHNFASIYSTNSESLRYGAVHQKQKDCSLTSFGHSDIAGSHQVSKQEAITSQITKEATNVLEAIGGSLRTSKSSYIDVSSIVDKVPSIEQDVCEKKRTRGGVTEPFPEKLHRMLREVESEGHSDIVSFASHGRAFAVHDMDRFVSEIMPRYFKQSKWNSFSRQLNLYGFQRMMTGVDAGSYYHELFLKGRPSLVIHMRRVGAPHGQDRRKFKQQQICANEPDFYSMKASQPNPQSSN